MLGVRLAAVACACFGPGVFILSLGLCAVVTCLTGCGREIVAEVEDLSGHTFVVLADYYNSEVTVSLDLEVRDVDSTVLHEFGSIGFEDPERLRGGSLQFSLYDDELLKVVALYEKGNPDVILAIADFSSKRYYPSFGPGNHAIYAEFAERLDALEESVGNTRLELKKYP